MKGLGLAKGYFELRRNVCSHVPLSFFGCVKTKSTNEASMRGFSNKLMYNRATFVERKKSAAHNALIVQCDDPSKRSVTMFNTTTRIDLEAKTTVGISFIHHRDTYTCAYVMN